MIALSFFALAAYVTVDSVRALLGYEEPRPSIVGIALAILSLVVMPMLWWAQRRAGLELGSRSAVADAKQTLLCTYLSVVLLVGLALNGLFGWSLADPIAGLIIAAIAIREGLRRGRAATVADQRLPRMTAAVRHDVQSGSSADRSDRRGSDRMAGGTARDGGRRQPATHRPCGTHAT